MSKQTKQIHLRLTEDEYNKLMEQKEFLEMPTYAKLLRMYIHTGICYKIDYSGFEELATQISRIGNNINQITKVANESKIVDASSIKSLKDEMAKIENILSENITNKAKITKMLDNNFFIGEAHGNNENH